MDDPDLVAVEAHLADRVRKREGRLRGRDGGAEKNPGASEKGRG